MNVPLFVCVIIAIMASMLMFLVGVTAYGEREKNNPAFKRNIDVVDKLIIDSQFYFFPAYHMEHDANSIMTKIPIPYDINSRITMLTDAEEEKYLKKLNKVFKDVGVEHVEFGNKSKGPFSSLIVYDKLR